MVGADIGHQLLRLVLEAAANAAKHSRAFRLSIRVRIEADEILLSVGNDRCVAPELATIAFVPRMLRARLDRLGGTMRVRPGRRHRGQRSREDRSDLGDRAGRPDALCDAAPRMVRPRK